MRISDWSSDVCSSDLCSNFSRYRSVCCSPWFLILTPSSRKASNSGSSRAVSTRRLAIGPPMMSIALRRLGSAIALWALASKSWEVTCMLMVMPPSVFLADGGRIGHAGQHLGDMAHLYAAALALQLAGHVEQAAHVAGQQQPGAGGGDIGGLAADAVGDGEGGVRGKRGLVRVGTGGAGIHKKKK